MPQRVKFKGDTISFSDRMSMDDIQDVLGALWSATQATGEFITTLGTGSVGEVGGGVTGAVTAAMPGTAPGSGGGVVSRVQEGLTYQPRTEAGRKAMQRISEDLSHLAESTGLDHMSGYWRDRVVPALQEQAGPIAGSALAAAGLGAIVGLAEMSPGGRALPKRQIGAIGDSWKVKADKMGYDVDSPVTSSGRDVWEITDDPTLPDGGENRFAGIFGSEGESSVHGGPEDIETTWVFKNDIAGSSDIDLDYDKSIATLKKEYPELDGDQLNQLYEMAAEDRNVFEMNENPISNTFPDLGEASWEGQRLRGKIAVDQGFDAINMSDEHGVSVLIPAGTEARRVDDPIFSAADKPEMQKDSDIDTVW